MSHDEGHALAKVDSFKDLNREDASTLIDRWTAMRDELQGTSDTVNTASATEESPGEADMGKAVEPGDSSPASDEAWSRAPKDMTLSGAVKLAGKLRQENRITGNVPKRKAEFTGDQLTKVSAAWRDGERG